jgi:hypothetical protein
MRKRPFVKARKTDGPGLLLGYPSTRPRYFPNLPAVDGCRGFVIAMSNKLPRAMRDNVYIRNLEEISHG